MSGAPRRDRDDFSRLPLGTGPLSLGWWGKAIALQRGRLLDTHGRIGSETSDATSRIAEAGPDADEVAWDAQLELMNLEWELVLDAHLPRL